ncbi:Uncharacterised protein [uncultured archaeon]|nr:Uncharacterised protein [uncultured archaeon]
MFNTFGSHYIIAGLLWLKQFLDQEAIEMRSTEENKWNTFNIGVYAIEVGLIVVILYALAALPALLKPMN